MYKSRIGGETTILYTQAEAAREIGVSERTMRSYIKRGLIPAAKIRRRVYIWDRHLMQFIRGAKSTKNMTAVPPPEYDAADFDGPPDPLYDEDGNDIFRRGL